MDGHGRPRNFGKDEYDAGRRCRYIQLTQEGFCNETQANQIAALCKLWHQLRFAPPNGHDIITDAERFNNMSSEEFEAFNQDLSKMGFESISFCQDCDETRCKCTDCAGA